MGSVSGVCVHLLSLDYIWARRWINHWSPWCMASAKPDLRLTFQPQGITAPWPVSNYAAWWQKHVCQQHAHSCYLKVQWTGLEPATFLTNNVTSGRRIMTMSLVCSFLDHPPVWEGTDEVGVRDHWHVTVGSWRWRRPLVLKQWSQQDGLS